MEFHMGTRGPFGKTSTHNNVLNGVVYQDWYRQNTWYTQDRLSRRKPLTYDMVDARVVWTGDGAYPSDVQNSMGYHYLFDPPSGGGLERSRAYNRLYERFRARVYEAEAQLATATAESGKSFDMIARRAAQLRKAYRNARKGKFAKYFVNGVFDPARGWRGSSKELGKLWLEFWLGWKPMVGDIYSACQVLSSEFPDIPVKVRANGSWSMVERKYIDYTFETREAEMVFKVRAACRVKVSNQNLNLANQLGLINPASFVWELVYLSFIVDWFINVGDVLQSWTDFVGLELIEPSTTELTTCKASYTWTSNVYNFSRSTKSDGVRMSRRLTMPPAPVLRFSKMKGLSPQRAATAVSLLVQTLKGGR